MTPEQISLTAITILIAIIGYFLNRILSKTESIGIDVSDMKPKLEILWQDKLAPSHSPRQLNDRGRDILNKSGIKEIVDEKKAKLLELIQEKKAKNPYDAEKAIEEVMYKLPEYCPDVLDKLKNGAFITGIDINSVLFVGSIYLRNEIFPTLGFSVTDLDILP